MPTISADKKTNKGLFAIVFVVVIAAVLGIFHLISGGIFLEWSNLKGIIAHIAYPSFIAWGFCFLFACGYTDMSIGGVIVLGSFAANFLGNAIGVPGVIIGGLVTGLILIMVNFLIFTYTGIPSWIAGISLALIYEAIALAIKFSDNGALFTNSLNRDYRLLGQLPWCVVILAIGLLVIYFLYNRTTIGLNIRSLGGNKEVSKALGINVNKTLLAVGLISGILIGIACFMQQSYAGQTTVKTGLTSINLIFQPLAIYLLAQIMQKRINIVIGVPICAFILYAVFNILTIMGVPSGTLQEACLGIFIVIFAIVGQRNVKGVIK